MSKKIAILYSGAKHWGGVEIYLENLFQGVDDSTTDLTLLSLGEWGLSGKLKGENYKVESFSGARVRLQTTFEIARYLRENDFDLLVTHGNVSNFFGRISGKLAGVKVLTTIHSELDSDYPNPIVRLVYTTIDRLTRHLTAHYIVVSEYLKNGLVRSGVRSDKINVILNGVKEVTPNFAEKSRADVGRIEIGSVGRLHKVKNYGELIKACSELTNHNWKLTIIGEGAERQHLETLIASLGLTDKVELVGEVEDASLLLGKFDIYVQPSLSEGFGLGVVEAMKAGLPVVVTAGGALSEIVEDGKTGIIAKGFGHTDIAEAIERIYSDEELRDKLGIEAKESAERDYSIDKWLEKTEEIYLKVAK